MKLYQTSKKCFSVLPKVPKMELTMRSPYKTFFKNFIGFQRIYINTLKGLMCISNRTPPVMYLLPAGEIKVTQMVRGDGNNTDVNSNGEFMHAGGYVVVHDNNTCDVNLFECVEKEKFAFDKVDVNQALTFEGETKFDRDINVYATKRLMRKK
jgi:hypothetical protein